MPSPDQAPASPRLGMVALAVVFVTFATYFPAMRAGFIWDDDAHVTAPALRSLDGLARIWTEPGATQQYYPLLHSAFWLEHKLWGDAPLGYHLANIALHAAVACSLLLLLTRLAVPGAWLAALLFAVHPVHVESVAWITEQKNTLSTILYLCAALAYLRFDTTRARSSYALALAFFVAALLTKTVTATLPAALLVIFWWQRGSLSWRRDVWPLAPWFVLGACAGLFTAWVERKLIGAEGAAYDLTLLQRLLLAGRVVWFYLGKLFLPLDLTLIYPRWTITAASPWPWLPLLGLGASLFSLGRWCGRSALAVLLLFIGSLFPALGFFSLYPFAYSFVADHFSYLASLSVFAFVAATLVRFGPIGENVGVAFAILLTVFAREHAGDFRDNEALFRATVARNPDAWMAHNNLGKELLREKSTQPEAISCFERALQLRPDYADAHNNLGLALAQSSRAREALPHLEAALRLKPDSYQTLNNLGIALAGLGRAEESVAAFQRAVRLNPTFPNLHENLAKSLRLAGRDPEATAEFAEAARLRAMQK